MRLILLLGALPCIAGCVETKTTGDIAGTPGSSGVGQAYGDAELVAVPSSGRHTAVGKGDSMAPVFTEDTVLVFTPINFADLRPGMNVAYVNSEGRRVVHCLIEKTTGGWTVLGLNNHRIDSELVTAANLLGVVYARFDPIPEEAMGSPSIPASSVPRGRAP